MTKRLEQAFSEAARLPDREQDALAEWLLAELSADRQWAELLSGSGDRLEELAKEALTEHRQARTQDLDPDKL